MADPGGRSRLEDELRESDRAAAGAPDEPSRIGALWGKATLLRRLGRTTDAAGLLDDLIARANELGDSGLLAELEVERALLAYSLGDGAGILEHAESALAAAMQEEAPANRAGAWRMMGIAYEFACRYREAEHAYRQALDLLEGAGIADHSLVSGVYNSLGEIARACDHPNEAIGWYEKAAAAFRRLDPARLPRVARGNQAAALVALGRHGEALRLLDDCLADAGRDGHRHFVSELHHYRAYALHGLGRAAEAAAAAGEALRLAREHGESEMEALALRACGALPAAAPPDGDPEACLRESVRLLAACGKRGEEARSRRALAARLRAAGREAEARAEYERAAALFAELQIFWTEKAVRDELAGG